MTPFDRARRVLSVDVDLRYWFPSLGESWWGFTKCVEFFFVIFLIVFWIFLEFCMGVREKVNNAFDRSHRALSVCVGFSFWSRGGVFLNGRIVEEFSRKSEISEVFRSFEGYASMEFE